MEIKTMAKRSKVWYQNLAGAALFVTGIVVLLGIITGEALYPGYSTSGNEISDLGGTRPPNSVIVQPSAAIFNATMIVSGLLVLLSTYCLRKASADTVFTICLGVFGLGLFFVGVFPGSTGAPHALAAMTTFVSGAVTAILSYRVLSSPLRQISVSMGVISLSALLLYLTMGDSSPFAPLGVGGTERWVAYPVVLFILGCGGYLLGRSSPGREA